MASILGISTATKSFLKEETTMADESKKEHLEHLIGSFKDVNKLRPQDTNQEKSFVGISNLRPNSQQGNSGQEKPSNQGDNNEKK